MKLSEVFNQLTFGELKQIGMGGYEQGRVQPENYQEIVNHINLAMLNIYTRFPIKENYLQLQTIAGKYHYRLVRASATSIDPINGFIIDSGIEPFTGDILRLESVWDSEGTEVAVNDENAVKSVFTSTYDTIRIPFATGEESLGITYRARPSSIVVPASAVSLDLNQSLDIPDVVTEALLVYIEYRVMKSRGGEAGLAQASIAKQHYETLCLDLDKRNVLRNANNTTNLKPKLNGWV